MIFTDKEAIRQLNIINHFELTESVENYPEDERMGRSDLEILLQESEYYLDMYDEDTVFYEELEDAKKFLRDSKNGKIIPCWNTTPPVPKFSALGFTNKINQVKRTINEYNRLKRGVERMRRLVR